MIEPKIIYELRQEKKRLEAVVLNAEKRLRKAPEGSVHIIPHGKGYQYYFREDPSDKAGTYIPAAEKNRVTALMQKKYDKKVYSAAGRQLSVLDSFLRKYEPDLLKDMFEALTLPEKQYVTVEDISDAEFAARWLEYEYEPKAFAEDAPVHYTAKGLRVRSKSEAMIADELDAAGIPYRYECPMELDGMEIYPDFTILRIRDRQEIRWEHLGLMDDQSYCRNALRKIRSYEKCGYYAGQSLILTMETGQLPLNRAVIRGVITAYCDPSGPGF